MPMAASFTKKGTIVYNTPFGQSTQPKIDFMYSHYSTGSGIVNLNQIVGKTLSAAVAIIAAVIGGATGAGIVVSVIIGVVAFIAGEVISYVTINTVSAEWYNYEVAGRMNNTYGYSNFGTTYSVRNPNGNEIGREVDNIAPDNWKSDHSALMMFSSFYSSVIYNGVSYFI